ncbi:cytochrome c [Neobacillus notoginsengisoli]|uniref:Cytochrome c n=1 Tax=Neobacillus notoginsengisoli TaxID=1578198 RepID=A0A417YUY6_9BACI|nr:cytochrome c [Neobacillus notoginsengisoli]RHW41032.1 cytochrome c [Neobacillus notoginsengisoli]
MKNPVVPFIMIMVLGIGLMFILSFKGLGDMKEVAEGGKAGGEKTTEVAKPEDLYQDKGCIGCHGEQLEGKSGPKLSDVGSKLDEGEIKDIIVNGKGSMPQGLATGADADALAKWLADKK